MILHHLELAWDGPLIWISTFKSISHTSVFLIAKWILIFSTIRTVCSTFVFSLRELITCK